MPRTRVLVVEDSPTVRGRLCQVLGEDPEIEVVGAAGDGATAVEMCRSLRPDVLTLDMVLPVMSGLATTEYIMAHFPTPILIVSASTNRGDLFKTYDALAAGAVEVLEKPGGGDAEGAWERRLVASVKLVARIKVITHPRARLRPAARGDAGAPEAAAGPAAAGPPARIRVLALGASTGGPGAILDVLRAIPAGFPLPLLIVLHLGEPFGAVFADWLGDQTPHPASYASDGEPVSAAAGRVVLAPPGFHLIVRDGRLRRDSGPERHSCRPSVDVLFESVAREYGASSAGCLLTGMGRDGAAGLLAIKRAGGVTMVQDEATCTVYGMPREAVRLGAAGRVLPLGSIGPALASLAAGVEAAAP